MSDKPIRVQLSRRKGWRMPPNTVKVSRPTKWGNPYRRGVDYYGVTPDRQGVVLAFRGFLAMEPDTVADIKRELRGKNLACWCPLSEPCHADVLLQIANEP